MAVNYYYALPPPNASRFLSYFIMTDDDTHASKTKN